MNNDSNLQIPNNQREDTTLHVSIPTELLYYLDKAPQKFLRLLSAWLILKSITSSGCIQNYRKQLPQLAATCKIAIGTFNIYLHKLTAENLLHVYKADLFLHRFEVLKRYRIL